MSKDCVPQFLQAEGAVSMAKRSKAKAKKAKPVKKKRKTAKKTSKRVPGPPVDPCQTEEDAVGAADAAVDEIKQDLDNPDLSAAQRKKLQQALVKAEAKLKAAQLKLGQCRRKHGGHPH
jgi:multidrug resistance efflux pump